MLSSRNWPLWSKFVSWERKHAGCSYSRASFEHSDWCPTQIAPVLLCIAFSSSRWCHQVCIRFDRPDYWDVWRYFRGCSFISSVVVVTICILLNFPNVDRIAKPGHAYWPQIPNGMGSKISAIRRLSLPSLSDHTLLAVYVTVPCVSARRPLWQYSSLEP